MAWDHDFNAFILLQHSNKPVMSLGGGKILETIKAWMVVMSIEERRQMRYPGYLKEWATGQSELQASLARQPHSVLIRSYRDGAKCLCWNLTACQGYCSPALVDSVLWQPAVLLLYPEKIDLKPHHCCFFSKSKCCMQTQDNRSSSLNKATSSLTERFALWPNSTTYLPWAERSALEGFL